MSGFSEILAKLGFGKKDKAPEAPKTSAPKSPSFDRTPAEASASRSSYAPKAKASDMEVVDVVAKLDSLAKSNPEELDWKLSIVDLLKLLDIDSSRENRNELAKELGIPADLMDDSAKMNVWLHKRVLQRIAENGGNVPKSLLD